MVEQFKCEGCCKVYDMDKFYVYSKGPYCKKCWDVIFNKTNKIKQEEMGDKMEGEYRARKRKSSKKVPSIAESVRHEQFEDKVEEEFRERNRERK
jgi:hypothetical protein